MRAWTGGVRPDQRGAQPSSGEWAWRHCPPAAPPSHFQAQLAHGRERPGPDSADGRTRKDVSRIHAQRRAHPSGRRRSGAKPSEESPCRGLPAARKQEGALRARSRKTCPTAGLARTDTEWRPSVGALGTTRAEGFAMTSCRPASIPLFRPTLQLDKFVKSEAGRRAEPEGVTRVHGAGTPTPERTLFRWLSGVSGKSCRFPSQQSGRRAPGDYVQKLRGHSTRPSRPSRAARARRWRPGRGRGWCR